jgi:hypothetical protein
MAGLEKIPRPHNRTPYTLYFATNSAKKGWRDLHAIRPSDLGRVWDFLAYTPLDTTSLSYPLKGELSNIVWRGESHQRWQVKLSRTDGARIWYCVVGRMVLIEKVHTHHPNETK